MMWLKLGVGPLSTTSRMPVRCYGHKRNIDKHKGISCGRLLSCSPRCKPSAFLHT
uniref:Uncharacterized protein n=1 Tax=Triticum urartu TaxID=4572 RepID=A0A8R7R0R7_TRIUA